MKASAAYDRGLSGKGVTIAVIDTGIATSNPEFAGRISPDSKALPSSFARCGTCAPETVTFGLDDIVGHGTETASIAAGAANGIGSQGVAPGATIMALKISSPDLMGVTSDSVIKESDNANPLAIAPAINYAVDKGAFVISMSLNGQSSGQVAADQRAAMDHVRTSNRLFVESVDNSIGVDSFAGTIAQNLVGADLANKDWFLFGIRVDANLQPPNGNGNPGILADRTLAVVASNVMAASKDGGTTTVTGNSFAAPAIAGAAALLKQYWPQLGGKEIARILLDTARDLSAPGPDPVYGVGLLDLENALRAQAPSVVTAQGSATLAGSALSFSGAFGRGSSSSVAQAFSNVVVLDRYGRDYRTSLSQAVSAGPRTRNGIRIAGALRPLSTLWEQGPLNQAGALRLASERLGIIGGHVVAPSQSGRFGFAMSQDSYVSGQVGGSIERSGLVTGTMLRSLGIASTGSDVAFSHGGWRFGLAGAETRRSRWSQEVDASYRGFSVTAPNGFTVGLASNVERGSAIGVRGTGALAIQGGTTTLLTFGWTGDLGSVRISGEAIGGSTRVRASSPLFRFDGPILSTAFRLQADAPAFGGVGTFGITSPLRVDRALLRLSVPTAYDWQTGLIASDARSVDLRPSARELNLEFGWTTQIASRGWLRFGVARAVSAGNVPGRQDSAGFASFTLR